ncbi:AI-2E family transporter [Muricauda oceani]|uniref:AI-2E family transporter n=1 Tax=Flagellimonas oceani TaxID=2698672 RepID=A0A6G7J0B7_9FLAO|nr:AI-2E family transporter [Allomuricauda oceani]MBW8243617.1 AI-2E family transporter [Allomuricauda oceani]QII44014.1 AI-2E family transporter [Allomuricauda oceani]
MNYIAPKIIRQIFILLLILTLGGLIMFEMAPYFSGVLGTITLFVLLKRPMKKLVDKGWNETLAASLLMVISFFIILLPISGAFLMLGNKISKAIENSEKVTSIIKSQIQYFENLIGYKLSSQIDASGISKWLTNNLEGLVGGTFNTVIAISIMYFLLFYMLTNQKKLYKSLFDYIPISNKNLKVIGNEINDIVRANTLGIPLVALAQGAVALIGFLIFGIENPFFWAVMVTIGSMIPFVGNLLGTVPVFILTLSNGQTFQAWGVLVYGIVVVGLTDNLIRLYVLKKLDNVHPLITLIGVIVGIPLFGFIGLVFGPLLINLFLVIVRIYKREYGNPRENQQLSA